MNTLQFCQLLTELDDSHIQASTKTPPRLWPKYAAVAACLSLVLAGALTLRPSVPALPEQGPVTEESAAVESSPEHKEATDFAIDAPAEDAPVIDAPVQNETILTPYDQIWGGSYLDDQGNWVVLLTEDTPENRKAVFQRNPSLPDSTLFLPADYSLAYLNQIMEKLSAAMVDGQLPFVSSAAVMEPANRVEVSLSDPSEANITAVLAFDPQGGAVSITQGSAVLE